MPIIFFPNERVTQSTEGQLNLIAGTTTQAPLHFTNGSLLTTPSAGSMEYANGHWYITNGARHSLSSTAGVLTSTVTTTLATYVSLYSYTFAANELHADERITFDIAGAVSAATGSETVTFDFRVAGVSLHTLAIVLKNSTNIGWEAKFQGTIRTVGVTGSFIDYGTVRTDNFSSSFGDTATTAIDTTVPVVFEVFVKFGTAKAGNSLSCTQGSLRFEH